MLMTEKKAAEFLGVSPVTLRTYRSRGVGPTYVRLGAGTIRYTRGDLENYINKHTVVPKRKEVA